MMAEYRRFCETLNSKGILIPADENIYNYVKNQNKDYYVSLYKYNEEHKKQFEKTGSISGITDTITNQLLWDFDKEGDFEAVREDTIKLIDRLKRRKINEEDIEVYFSGNKGTHVAVKLNEDINSQQFKVVTKALAEGLGTYDSSVSNPSRIVRVAYTKHHKTPYYKTPLSMDELKNSPIEEIREIAGTAYTPEIVERHSYPVPKVKGVKAAKASKSTPIVVNEELELDYSKKPKWLSHWKYALLHGYFPEGTRSYALMVLAATYRGQGLPDTVTYHALKGAAELQAERYGGDKFPKEEIYQTIIGQVYGPNWTGGTYAEENFPDPLKDFLIELGVPKQESVTLEDQQVERVSEGFGEFAKYAEDIDKYTMKFGIESLDHNLKIRKGHLIGLIAPPGVGKTSMAISILNNMSKAGTHCYFGSYDMFKHNVYQKLIQRHANISEQQLFNAFTNKDTYKINKWKDMLNEEYENVSFCFKVGQTIEDLKESIRLQEEKVGKPVDLVVVDYLELVLTKSSDPTAASAEAAQGLREIANAGRVVVMLLQPNKMSSKPNEPLLSYNAAKGSSAIAQAATAILTAHRPGLSSQNPEDDRFFCINCVKNRNGALFALDFAWDGPTQMLSDLDQAEREALEDLRKIIKEEKARADIL